MHVRSHPARHVLKYPLYFFAFDLDELSALDSGVRLFSYNGMNVASLRDRDYLKGEGPIKEKLFAFLKRMGKDKGVARVELVTQARYFGYVFNPVSFYFCFDSGGAVQCVLAEVNNTFGEKHLYFLSGPKRTRKDEVEFRHDKEFHVSPFNNLDGYYTFRFSLAGEGIRVRIVLHREGREVMTALLEGKAVPFTSDNLGAVVRRYPLTTLLTISRIYREAFKLFFFRKLGYHPKPEPSSAMTVGRLPATLTQRIARRGIERVLSRIRGGRLSMTYPDGEVRVFGDGDSPDTADITVNGYSFFSKVFFNGEIGFGESFMEHGWDSSDPVGLLRFFIRHLGMDDENHVVLKSAGRLLNRLLNRKRKNTLSGSRKNIGEHYDLGNDFFSTFLDRRLVYSCGIFKRKTDTLEQAQINKIHAIIEKAQIRKGDRVLEIGSGWGGFAVEAARSTGCHVTTITLSNEQRDHVLKLIARERLGARVSVELVDYRHVKGQFDKIVSIEMLEAVGHENFPIYFASLERVLKPQGIAVLQVITTMDYRYSEYLRRIDWIQKHIFPGGHLPSLTALSESMAKHSRFYIDSLENIGPHYARTLREWRNRFIAARERLISLGYDGAFQRKWLYYLSVCEAGFASGTVNDLIITLKRSAHVNIPSAGG